MKRPQFVINFEFINGYPMIKTKIGEQSGYLLLDTSSKSCILNDTFFRQYGNKDIVLPCAESNIGKTISILTICDFEFKIPMIIKPLDAPNILGVLGTNFFSHWKIIIDFNAEMLYSYSIE